MAEAAVIGSDREILLACAAGAGLGAVYAVPLAGALFSVRIMLKTWQPRALGAALITSSLAVAIGSAITHDHPSLDWPSRGFVVSADRARADVGAGDARWWGWRSTGSWRRRARPA